MQRQSLEKDFKTAVARHAAARPAVSGPPARDQIGLSDEWAAECHQIGFATLEDLAHHLDAAQPADHHDGGSGQLSDASRPPPEVGFRRPCRNTGAKLGLPVIFTTQPLADWTTYPGAESWRLIYARVSACLERLTRDGQEPLIVVSHAIPTMHALCWWLHLDIDPPHGEDIGFAVDPASLTVLRVEAWGAHTVERLNDTAHLYAAGLAKRIGIE